MKKIITSILLLVSAQLLSQDRIKTYKADNVEASVLEQKAESVNNSNASKSAEAGKTGTLNGSIVADLSVSNTGAVNYSVPINVPPGLNNIQPDIALTFDSQSGNGLAGWGWNVSGISVITRIPSTSFHDGQIDAVDFDSNDRFALDGQRLELKSGSYGAAGAIYETEQYSNVKVISYGSNNGFNISGPEYFKVFYPDGSIGHYGSTPATRSHMDYALTYWENPQGVRVSYTYFKSKNTLYPEKISYGSRGASTPINEIEFVYEDRDFKESSYIGGIRFVRDERLQQILVKGSGGALYRRYLISDSQTSLGYSRVTNIREYTSDNSEQRNISFEYDQHVGNQGFSEIFGEATQLDVTKIEQRNAAVLPLDLNGNGKMDFVLYPTYGSETKSKFWFFEDIDNSGGFNYSDAINTSLFQELFPVNWLNNENKLMPNQALAFVESLGGDRVNFRIMAKETPSANAITNIYNKTWNLPTVYNQYDQRDEYISQKYLSGDFDGDGLSDIVAIAKPFILNYGPNSIPLYDIPKAHLIKLDRRDVSEVGIDLGDLTGILDASDRLFAVDVTGDGKTNIVRFKANNLVEVYGINEAGSAIELLWNLTDSDLNMQFLPMPGDYNGDGKGDFLIPLANNSDDFFMLLSTGDGFEKRPYLSPGFVYRHTDFDSNSGTLYGYNLIPVDINGDGKTDIIEYNTETYNGNDNGKQYIRIHNNRMHPYNDVANFASTDPIETTGNLKHYPIPIFLSSNDKNSNLEFATISNKWVRSYTSLLDHRQEVTLEKISNNGVETNIKYDNVNTYYTDSDDPDFFKSYSSSPGGLNQVFPYVNVDVAPTFKVVRELLQTGSGLTRTKRFYYENAVSTTNGLGFAGFEVVKRSNWNGINVPEVWTISKHNPLLRGAIVEQVTSSSNLTNPTHYASKVNYYYNYQLVDNPSFPQGPTYPLSLTKSSPVTAARIDEAGQSISLLPGFHVLPNVDYTGRIIPPGSQSIGGGYAGATDILLNRVESDNGLTGVLTTETYVYDQYRNITIKNSSFPGGSKVSTTEYYNNSSATSHQYHVGRPKKISETITLNGDSFNSEIQFSYNNNLITQIKKKGNGTAWINEDYVHNSDGNIITRTLTDGTVSRTQNFEYNNYGGRFLTKSTNIEGLQTTFSYDPITGDVVSTIDGYGLTTQYLQDKWGRIVKETDYLNKETNHTYIELQDGELKHTTDYPDGAKDETLYNAFGWVTKSGALSLNNQWIYTSYEYDVSGRTRRESEPHNGSPGQWNTYIFDEYGRPISQQLFTGRNITITYSGLSSTVNDGVKSVTTTLDALGNTVQSQDPGGTIDYTYFANGTMKTSNYDGHIVSVGIDGWGRRTSLNDPSAGNYTYEYNELGDLLKETTPTGTTTFTYDNNGKVQTKNVLGDLTDLTLDYFYDGTTKQLTKIDGTDNTNSARSYVYDYEYDGFRRLEKVKENTGLTNFEYQLQFDIYGRVEKESHISNLTGGASKNITTRNVYDTSGILKEIWNDGTPDKLWELDQINARGQALSINLGNGITRTKNYDGYGYTTKIEDKESGANPTIALHVEYDFNAQRGTLNSRENFGFDWQESFGYDQLDRLTTISGDVTKTMTFDNRGRINNNTEIGGYAYATPKNYRLNEIDPNTSGETYFQQHPTQQIAYNAFKKPINIHEAGHGRVSFEYGPLMNRSTAYYGGEDEDRNLRRYRKHYSAIMPAEIVEDTQTGSTKIINYIAGDAYSAPIAHIKQSGANSIDEYHYLHRDYLGSILAITDADGDVKEEVQFGAWGTVDAFLNSSGGTVFDHTSLLGRGYTGHEHFFEVSLIHMNGRMYDANLGRFLSPDNYIEDPFNTQSYNRYGYVLNNPLMYTDPSGECIECVVGVGIFLVGLVANAIWGSHDANPLIADGFQGATPIPANNQNNTQMASSMSRQSRGSPTNFELPSWESVWGGIKEFGTRVVISGKGALNAWTSNQVFGIGRFDANSHAGTEYDFTFRAGQVAGDLASIVTGVEEIVSGAALAVGGVAGTPFTLGSSLAATVAGGAVVAHGLTAVGHGFSNATRGISNLFDSFGKSSKPLSRKVARGQRPKNSGKLHDIPGLGERGKLDGLIPTREQWLKYPKEDLRQLQTDLGKSIRKRTIDLRRRGADYIHGLRLTDERNLLRDITKHLDGK